MTEQQKTAKQLVEQANVLWKADKNEEAIALCDGAIKLDPNFAPAFMRRGTAKSDLGQHEEAIKDYDEAIRLRPDYADAYNNRAMVKDDLKRYKEAIADYDKAISLKPDYSWAYNNRGVTYENLGLIDEALKDYSDAIRLAHEKVRPVYNRGELYYKIGKHQNAIDDFTSVVALNPKHAIAFYYRGNSNAKLEHYEEALKDYDEAVKLKKRFPAAYAQRAAVLKILKRYEAALESFEEAKKNDTSIIDPFSYLILREIKELNLGMAQGQFIELLKGLHEKIQEIKKNHLVSETDFNSEKGNALEEKYVAHYSDLVALRNMLPWSDNGSAIKDKNLLRLYNVAYMNDPEEGKMLLKISQEQKNAYVLHEFFDEKAATDDHHKLLWGNGEFAFYLSSFTRQKDRLDLWRAYGKDGTGLSIAIPFEAFSQTHGSILEKQLKQKNSKDETRGSDDGKDGLTSSDIKKYIPPTLYKIIYEASEMIEALKQLDPQLRLIKQSLSLLQNEHIDKTIKSIVRVLLSDILYLYKNDEYENEKEMRIISFFEISDLRLKLDERIPSRVYAETHPFLFGEGSQIIIGPKVAGKVETEYEIKFRLTNQRHMNCKTKVFHSTVRYR